MKTHWHVLQFKCSCGRDATILEVAVKSDGFLALAGLCAVCGEELSQQVRLVDAMATSAILDYKVSITETALDQFENFVASGKPS